MQQLDFKSFRDGLGGVFCRRLGVNISACQSWMAFTSGMLAYNSSTNGYALVRAAQRLAKVASTGERALLVAVLHACDLSKVADKLSKNYTWQRMDEVFGEHRLAVAACIARID